MAGTLERKKTHTLYVVSGGFGASGEQLARTALAQFSDPSVTVTVVPQVQSEDKIREVVERAALEKGTVLHTLVDVHLRTAMLSHARRANVVAIDAMGRLLSRLADVLGQEPLGQPGLYRQLRRAYYERVDSIEFAVAHDDGQRPEDLPLAEIVLVGPSRVGKTPLSMYLSVQGWKVANVPLVEGIEPPPQLLQLDRRKVVGLIIDPMQLLSHRKSRQARMGTGARSAYVDPRAINEEIRASRRFFRRQGFVVIDVTEKPIEESANEVITLVT